MRLARLVANRAKTLSFARFRGLSLRSRVGFALRNLGELSLPSNRFAWLALGFMDWDGYGNSRELKIVDLGGTG